MKSQAKALALRYCGVTKAGQKVNALGFGTELSVHGIINQRVKPVS